MSGTPADPPPPPEDPRDRHLLDDGDDSELVPEDSVFGDEELPEMQPNLSDGSTKLMTNQALHEMGLQFPDGRADGTQTETFSMPDVAPVGEEFAPPSFESPEEPALESDTALSTPEAVPAPESEPELNLELLNFSDSNERSMPTLQEGSELSALDQSAVAFAMPSPSSPRLPLPKPSSEPLIMPPLDVLPPPAVAAPLPRPALESPTLEMPQLSVAETELPAMPLPAQARPKSSGQVTVPPTSSPVTKPAPLKSESQPAPPANTLAWTLLISYASAMTLALLYLLMSGGGGPREHHLESLPDVAPEPPKELSYIPSSMELAPGHTLRLGEQRRFGNILVEPVRVTREPLTFQHFTGNAKKQRDPSPPVLKLWLKFTNVSTDQTIAPLDGPLLFKYVVKAGASQEYSNQYLFPADQRDNPASMVSIYRHPIHADWDLVGQSLGKPLAPGESIEMFVPSTEDGTAELNAAVAWRVQMRKGFSPSGNGVTTMIEVNFDWEQVQTSPG